MATIKDVAKRANVSTTTVSHVINKTRFVAEETRNAVWAASSTPQATSIMRVERVYFRSSTARRAAGSNARGPPHFLSAALWCGLLDME